jgi:hypothetical protein
MAARYPTAAELRLCVDRVVPADFKTETARRSVSVNPANDPLPHLRRARLPGVSLYTAKLALLTGKRWPDGQVLGIRFLDGSSTQRTKVQSHAEEWLAWADLRFDWSAGSKAQVRISFQADPGSWSAIGTDCLSPYFKKNDPTMNFGWLRDDTDEVEYRRVVVHELGHALGAIHEHQNPRGGIVWNEAAVYAAFSGPPNNWSRAQIRANILDKYSYDQLNATTFDPKSIMLYPFPKELIKGPPSLARKGTATNTDLSAKDKSFIAKMYPKG